MFLLPVKVANRSLYIGGFPTKHAILLVVTVTGRGPYPMDTSLKHTNFDMKVSK